MLLGCMEMNDSEWLLLLMSTIVEVVCTDDY